MSVKLDGKFHGVVVKNKDGSVVPQDEWMVFLAKDNAVPQMLRWYLNEIRKLGAGEEQCKAVQGLIGRVDVWRENNPEECKVPDVQDGEIIL